MIIKETPKSRWKLSEIAVELQKEKFHSSIYYIFTNLAVFTFLVASFSEQQELLQKESPFQLWTEMEAYGSIWVELFVRAIKFFHETDIGMATYSRQR